MIPFSPPRIDQKIIDEVVDTLKSGWITTGPKTKLFEKKITEYTGCKTTVAVNSATAGLELVLRWFGVGEGDEVILPAYTYAATANVVMHCGATLVFVDINADDFNISIRNVAKAISTKTKVIMPVDFAGFPCDFDQLNELVASEGFLRLFNAETENQQKLGRILILSDAAHSFGASVNGKMTGSLTDISVFSFHAVKNLTTAEGGAISFNLPEPFDHEAIYNYFNTLILHGQDKDALAKTKKGNWEYDIVFPGYKANMTDILASIGLVELQRYDDETLARRRAIFDKYSYLLAKYQWAELPVYENDGSKGSYHIYPLRIKGVSLTQRNAIIAEIFEHDVSVNVHFKPVPMMGYYKHIGYDINEYPIALDAYSREISLPVYFDLSDESIETVVNAVVNSVQKILQQL
jgi:dTDP-4-amino-4,6-dideoxygalactose transaminase